MITTLHDQAVLQTSLTGLQDGLIGAEFLANVPTTPVL